MSVEERVKELNLELPPAPEPLGVYRPVLVSGKTAYTSGHGPVNSDGSLIVGRVGEELDRRAGFDAARQTGLAVLASLRAELGSLNRVKRVVKTLGMVNCALDFKEHPAVVNGFSELMVEVFGRENGIGARSAVGVGSLPGNIPVEIEAVFEID